MLLFKTQQKTKEIGIRKVNGATIVEIMFMLNKDFVKWVFVALAGFFTLVIALLTVSWQTYRAATKNPVESLRDE